MTFIFLTCFASDYVKRPLLYEPVAFLKQPSQNYLYALMSVKQAHKIRRAVFHLHSVL